jgi:hypothetical protein
MIFKWFKKKQKHFTLSKTSHRRSQSRPSMQEKIGTPTEQTEPREEQDSERKQQTSQDNSGQQTASQQKETPLINVEELFVKEEIPEETTLSPHHIKEEEFNIALQTFFTYTSCSWEQGYYRPPGGNKPFQAERIDENEFAFYTE